MTENARNAGPGDDPGPVREQVVIRDKRKIDASGRPRIAEDGAAGQAGSNADGDHSTGSNPPTGHSSANGGDILDAIEVVAGEVITPEDTASGSAGSSDGSGVPSAVGAQVEALHAELDERLRDLQRVTAEYANYRKRVDRDRAAVVEQAIGMVISALLPILDDFDRAREHDDLVGPLGAVAEQLSAALAKFGLTGFGELGDAFDPTRHEAVAHETSPDVTEPTCVSVMRRGYLLGDRLLRAALVGVADPE